MSFYILSYKQPDYYLIKYEYIKIINGIENIVKSGYCTKLSPIPNGILITSKEAARKFHKFKEIKKYISTNAMFKENSSHKTWEDLTVYSTIHNWTACNTFEYECFEIQEFFENDYN